MTKRMPEISEPHPGLRDRLATSDTFVVVWPLDDVQPMMAISIRAPRTNGQVAPYHEVAKLAAKRLISSGQDLASGDWRPQAQASSHRS